MADIADIFKQLRTDLLNDSTFAGMLGETNGIYAAYPKTAKTKPIIVMMIDTGNPQSQISSPGIYRPDLAFDVFTLNPYNAHAIFTYLQENWDIPKKRATAITTADWRITLMRFTDLIEVEGKFGEVATGDIVRQFHITVNLRISRRPT